MELHNISIGNRVLSVSVSNHEGERWASLRDLCSELGLIYPAQCRDVVGNPVFKSIRVPTGFRAGTVKIAIKSLAMWLCTLNANKVKLEWRDPLCSWQRAMQPVAQSVFQRAS